MATNKTERTVEQVKRDLERIKREAQKDATAWKERDSSVSFKDRIVIFFRKGGSSGTVH